MNYPLPSFDFRFGSKCSSSFNPACALVVCFEAHTGKEIFQIARRNVRGAFGSAMQVSHCELPHRERTSPLHLVVGSAGFASAKRGVRLPTAV